MKEILKQLLIKLTSSILFFLIMFFVYASLITGQFPPNKAALKEHFKNMADLKKQTLLLAKNLSERTPQDLENAPEKSFSPEQISKQDTSPSPKLTLQKITETLSQNSSTLTDINDLKLKMDLIVRQNNEIKAQLAYVLDQNRELQKQILKDKK